jgi:hypothetical protein
MSSIRADIQLNAAPFLAGMARVQGQMRNIQVAAAGLTGAFFAARAALAGFSGVLSAMKGTLDLGGTLNDLAASTGVAAGEMLVMQRAFQDSGMGAEEAGTMLNRMQRAIVEAGQGSATHVAAFEQLGLSVGRLSEMSPEQQMRTIGQAIALIGNDAQSTALSMDIFGRAGGRLKTFFADFDGNISSARTAVGGLADTMNANAQQFDFISDAITGASQKLQQFFGGFLGETIDAEPFEALNRLDLTGAGEAVGQITNGIVGMVSALKTSLPVFAGLAAGFIALRTGMAGALATGFVPAMSSLGAVMTAAGARLQLVGVASKTVFGQMAMDVRIATEQARVGFTGMTASARAAAAGIQAAFATTFSQIGIEARVASTMARTAFASMVAGARAAGAGMKAALISTGIGAVIVGIGLAIEAVMAKINAANEKVRALKREGGDMSRNVMSNVSEIKTIGNADEQAAMMEKLDDQIANVRERLSNVDEDYTSDEAIAAATEQLQAHIAALERQKKTVQNITPAYMAQVMAIREQEAALAAAKQRAEELRKEVSKGLESRDADARKRSLADASPQEAEAMLLGEAGASSFAAVQSEIEAIQQMGADATDQQVIRLSELLGLEKELIDVQQRQAQEREKAAQQAEQLADMQRDMVLDAEKAVAEASGDKAGAAAIEQEQRARQIANQLEGQGMDPAAAAEMAQKQAELQRLTGELQDAQGAQPQQGDAQRSIGLGGSAGLGPSIDVQKQIAKKQDAANSLLTQIKELVKNRQVVRVAEVFD